MAKKRTVIYKLERHKWPDEIAAEKRERRFRGSRELHGDGKTGDSVFPAE